MDDGGCSGLGVGAHSPPDFHDVATGCIDDIATGGLNLLHESGGSAKGRHDHDVVGSDLVVLLVHLLPGKRDDPHTDQLAVDLGVVDDLTNQENAILRKNPASSVGQIDRAFHPVTKSKCLSQAKGGVIDGEGAATTAELFHDGRAIVLLHLRLNLLHDIGTTHVDTFALLLGGGVTHGGTNDTVLVFFNPVLGNLGRESGIMPRVFRFLCCFSRQPGNERGHVTRAMFLTGKRGRKLRY